jgi:hypothetical protein
MRINRLRRREFNTLLGGATFGWPLAVHAQASQRPLIVEGCACAKRLPALAEQLVRLTPKVILAVATGRQWET